MLHDLNSCYHGTNDDGSVVPPSVISLNLGSQLPIVLFCLRESLECVEIGCMYKPAKM